MAPSRTSRPSIAARLLVGLLCLLCMATVSGCRGCRDSKAKKKATVKKIKPKPKDRYEHQRIVARPCDGRTVSERRGAVMLSVKPGHLTSVQIEGMKANEADFVGSLVTAPVTSRLSPLPLNGDEYSLSSVRDVALPKRESKILDTALFLPPIAGNAMTAFWLEHRGGRREVPIAQPTLAMPSYQYHFVVLANLPTGYKFIESLESVAPRGGFSSGARALYQVELVPGKQARWMLPKHALMWTSTAYVLWDDFQSTQLEPAQREAMLDWLHWGGQVIVSGPGSLDTLRGSFLEPYLPAESAGNVELGAAELAPLETWWDKPSIDKLAVSTPWSAVKLKLRERPEVRFVPEFDELVAEGNVGRGRIVVTAFRLAGRDLTTWSGFDSFFNAVLMNRPRRRIANDQDGKPEIGWADRAHRFDPARTTQLRFFTRDTGRGFENCATDVFDFERLDVAAPRPATGMAGWDDFGPVAQAARAAVINASRIEIPQREFVIWVVAGYLLVLVPVNWLVFRALDRVEWAWAAAPVIALACTMIVIHAAQLDIGFARAMNEVAVLEIQGEHVRGHLTRYMSLYTSLSTEYDITSDDAGAMVHPFSRRRQPGGSSLTYDAPSRMLTCRRTDGTEVDGLFVPSNDYGLVHSEQMVKLPGPLDLVENRDGGMELHNESGLRIQGAGVVRRSPQGKMQVAWLGDIRPNEVRKLVWDWDSPTEFGSALWAAKRDNAPITRESVAAGELHLRELLNLAQQAEAFRPGQTRLVAWTEDAVPGVRVSPGAPQTRSATMILAELRRGFGEAPQPDVNYVRRKRSEEIDMMLFPAGGIAEPGG
ncbi:MAG: hypothetical protein ACOY3P_02835 [Planctomycetota bacterium]